MMSVQRQGIVRGKRIELDEETGLPPGSVVTVELRSVPSTLEERRRLIDGLRGAWDDDSLDPIFEEIQRERALTRPRDSAFDATP